MLARRLLAGYVGRAAVPAGTWYGLFNGRASSGSQYLIGSMTSTDYGATWTEYASNPVLGVGTGWDDDHVKDPWLVWDGVQYVAYYSGNLNTYPGTYQIGRATAPYIAGPWTKDVSNPVIAASGGVGDADRYAASFPVVVYDPGLSPAWRMWYAGWSAEGTPVGITVCYADSTDGITWTKRGRVLDLGAGGTFDASAVTPGCVIESGGTWYVFYTGYSTVSGFMKSAYATCTDPADSGTYTKQGQLANYTGSLVLNGVTYRSNQPRGILPDGSGGYHVYCSLWNDAGGLGYEAMGYGASATLTGWPTPSLVLTIPGSGWDATTAENPSVIAAP